MEPRLAWTLASTKETIVAKYTGLVLAPPPSGLFFSRKSEVGINMETLRFASNGLILLCGPAGSGKSYFAKKFFRPTQIISSDDCRARIADDPDNQRVSPDAFDLLHTIVGLRLKWNRLTVVDATNLTGEYRNPLIRLAAEFNRPIYLILFETDFDTCLRFNAQRLRKIGQEVITRHHEKFSRIRESIRTESYHAIYTVRPEEFENILIAVHPNDD
jgi:protein phosphatase